MHSPSRPSFRVVHAIAVGAMVCAKVIEPDTCLRHDFMGIRCCHLAEIKRVSDHEVMNAVGAAEVEAEQLEWPQPPRVHDLSLLYRIAWCYVTVIVHV